MSVPVLFLKCVGKGCLNLATGGMLGVAVDVGTEIMEYVWRNWRDKTDETERLQELQVLAEATPQEMQEYVQVALEEIAEETGERPNTELQQQIAGYLYHIPSQIRRTMKRPSDPTGTTIPAGMQIAKTEDLLALLPERLPRFKEGDQPIPGVDLQIVELLGVGGFGEVWKARNPHLKSAPPVALKFCLNEEARKTLRHEAAVLDRVIRQGKHPGIVELRHTYLSADPPCLEYEFVDGGDLAGVIQEWHRSEKGVSAKKAAQVIRLLAEIIAFAHRQNPPIVHRDLKPANILIKKTDKKLALKVADFGIGGVAAAVAAKDQKQQTSRSQSLKQTIVGSYTPLYASPEQMRGGAPDPRDDVHALGVIWFQMMAGDLSLGAPSGGRWKKAMIAKGMSEEMIELMESCFESHADDRPSDGGELMRLLDELLKAPQTTEPTKWFTPEVEVVDATEEMVELFPVEDTPRTSRSQGRSTQPGSPDATTQKAPARQTTQETTSKPQFPWLTESTQQARSAETIPTQRVPLSPKQTTRVRHFEPYMPGASNRVPAGLCAIFLGCLGIHKFVIGLNTAGVLMLVVSVMTCGLGAIPMAVVGIIEGICYLSKTDEEFHETYIVHRKDWF